MSPQALVEKDIQEKLKALPAWKYEEKALVRTEKFPTYLKALDFVYKVGQAAEENDHHPDIIMNFKTVTVRYWTHTANGVTELDMKMAGIVEELIKEFLRA